MADSEKPQDDAERYEQRKERERKRQADQARKGANLGEIPAVKDPERRARAEACLATFAATYFAERFNLPSAPHHREEWKHLQRVIVHGGKQAIGDPRGDGKTTRLEVAILVPARETADGPQECFLHNIFGVLALS